MTNVSESTMIRNCFSLVKLNNLNADFTLFTRTSLSGRQVLQRNNVTLLGPDIDLGKLGGAKASFPVPGNIVFSSISWFGVTGTNVTFTAATPLGASQPIDTPHIIGPPGSNGPIVIASRPPRPSSSISQPPVAPPGPPMAPSTILATGGGGDVVEKTKVSEGNSMHWSIIHPYFYYLV